QRAHYGQTASRGSLTCDGQSVYGARECGCCQPCTDEVDATRAALFSGSSVENEGRDDDTGPDGKVDQQGGSPGDQVGEQPARDVAQSAPSQAYCGPDSDSSRSFRALGMGGRQQGERSRRRRSGRDTLCRTG